MARATWALLGCIHKVLVGWQVKFKGGNENFSHVKWGGDAKMFVESGGDAKF